MFIYAAGTTTKQNAFTDSTGLTALPNPILLNARGDVAPSATGTSCGLWLDPTLAYKMVLAPPIDSDPPTNPIWTLDQVVSANYSVLASLAAFEASVTGIPIGTQMAYAGSAAPAGWLLCYGQAISRTTYAALFAIIGVAYGSGDGSSTFNLPDKRGRVSIGKDDMGGSAANRITVAVSGLNGTTLGAGGGDQNAYQDILTAASTAVTAINDPGHLHPLAMGHGQNTGPGGSTFGAAFTNDGYTENSNTATTGVSATTSVSTSVTSSSTGTSQNVQPSEIDSWIIYTGVA
jgi:microcystin-dependent protein